MKRQQQLLLITIAALLVSVVAVIVRLGSEASAQSATNKITVSVSESKRLQALFDNYFEEFLRLNPLFATSIGDHRCQDAALSAKAL